MARGCAILIDMSGDPEVMGDIENRLADNCNECWNTHFTDYWYGQRCEDICWFWVDSSARGKAFGDYDQKNLETVRARKFNSQRALVERARFPSSRRRAMKGRCVCVSFTWLHFGAHT